MASVRSPRPKIVTPQQEEERFFTTLLANEEVEFKPLDPCTAASLGHIEQLTRFAAGELDACNNYGWTPLMYAACLGHTSTVQYLGRRRVSSAIYIGCVLNGNESREQTALMLAAANGHDESVMVLLNLPDCKANAVDNRGWTALFYAIYYGHPSTAEILLRNGTDPNITEKGRCACPLIVAAEAGFDDLVRILLRYGADISLKTTDGCLAIDAASLRGHVQVVNILQRAQAKTTRPFPGLNAAVMAAHEKKSQISEKQSSASADVELIRFLNDLGLGHYVKDFASHQISYDKLVTFDEDSLRQLPFLTVGARKQVLLEISKNKASSSTTAADSEVAKIFIPSNPSLEKAASDFLNHVQVLVSHCSILNDSEKPQLISALNQSKIRLQSSNGSADDSSAIMQSCFDQLNSHCNSFLYK